MRAILTKILGDPNTKAVKRLQSQVERINALEAETKTKSLTDLRAQTDRFKQELAKGKSLDEILPAAFAAVREMARRRLGQRHFDVQLVGGMALHQGKIAEMKTGEGKTLVATLPVYLNALSGKGVHIITVNDFLAQRDAGWMGPIYHGLGLSVGVIISGNQALVYDPKFENQEHEDERLKHLKPATKKEAYAADITYGTNNEFGFDYLRDNMAPSLDETAQRPLSFAIVDEVDSILIDEARTPLIISAPAVENQAMYMQFSQVAKQLKLETDFVVDEKAQAATLTDTGVAKVEKLLGVDNLYDSKQVQLIYHLEQALRAEALFRRDKDYVVKNGEVIIVDEFTGRMLPGRRYSEGLHQAIEAKEGVRVLQESSVLATISFQNYFRLYTKLAGMTGTAMTEAEEFRTVYDLEVVSIPTNQPMIRQDAADRIYKTEAAKFKAIVEDVAERHKQGQPVLIGTVSIEKNEVLGDLLSKAKVPYEILNAKNHEREANIIAKAGQPGAVTLATNIAGRGVDIILGKGVVDVGGLHVLGSERHEARRIDNQLRGRSGRQGDPGTSQFYVSLEDELMRVFGGERIAGLMNTLRVDENTPIENRMVSKALESAQKRIENHNFDIRKQVLQYDDVMNRHRESIYGRRRQILEAKDLKAEIKTMIERQLTETVKDYTNKDGEIDRPQLLEMIDAWLPLDKSQKQSLAKTKDDDLAKFITKLTADLYQSREKEFGADTMRLIERLIYLQVVDRLWMAHLETMNHLREGIRWRAVGQRDPLAEYKREAFEMFNHLNAEIDHGVISNIFRVAPTPAAQQEMATELTQAADQATVSGPPKTTSSSAAPTPAAEVEDSDGEERVTKAQTIRHGTKIGRNDPCPCGSGLKYKKCGLINAPEHQARTEGNA